MLSQARDPLRLCLGEKAPTLVPVSQVMMCMNCTSDFSLTLRRHHCHSCGRVSHAESTNTGLHWRHVSWTLTVLFALKSYVMTQIVCRSCSRNRYPLKYMKDRMAKVCDHCYNELRKRGELCFYSMSAAPLCRPSSGLCSYVYVADAPAPSSQSSPRPHRSSRPLSAVFQNIHPPNIWRHRKGIVTFTQVRLQQRKMAAGGDGSRLRWPLLLLQVTVSEEGSISGSLQRSKKSKRSWKRLWFLLKDKVLYTYRAQEVRRNEHAVALQTKPDL